MTLYIMLFIYSQAQCRKPVVYLSVFHQSLIVLRVKFEFEFESSSSHDLSYFFHFSLGIFYFCVKMIKGTRTARFDYFFFPTHCKSYFRVGLQLLLFKEGNIPWHPWIFLRFRPLLTEAEFPLQRHTADNDME